MPVDDFTEPSPAAPLHPDAEEAPEEEKPAKKK